MSDEIIKNKRWYDFDPTIRLAVDMFEKSSKDLQIKLADYIIEEAKGHISQEEEKCTVHMIS